MGELDWNEKQLAKLERSKPVEYINVVDTAKLIRVQLKKNFPGVKFGVRSEQYSMGASINIHWTDGPTKERVEKIVNPFCGGRFDGMIDLAYNVRSWLLPDGSAAFGKSSGTGSSHGSDPGYDNPAPCEGARLVDFAADHIFCNRSYSELAMLKACLTVHEKYGLPLLTVKDGQLSGDVYASLPNAQSTYWQNDQIVRRELSEMAL